MKLPKTLEILRYRMTTASAFARIETIAADIATRGQALRTRRDDLGARIAAFMAEADRLTLVERVAREGPLDAELHALELAEGLHAIEVRAFDEQLALLQQSLPAPRRSLKLVRKGTL